MNYEQKCELHHQMKLKRIKQKDLAKLIGCSNSWISQFFADKVQLSEHDLQEITDYINNK